MGVLDVSRVELCIGGTPLASPEKASGGFHHVRVFRGLAGAGLCVCRWREVGETGD